MCSICQDMPEGRPFSISIHIDTYTSLICRVRLKYPDIRNSVQGTKSTKQKKVSFFLTWDTAAQHLSTYSETKSGVVYIKQADFLKNKHTIL